MSGSFLKGLSSFLVLLLFGVIPGHIFAADVPIVPSSAAQQLLQRMVDAHHQLSYKGRFTYEHGGVLRTMEVVHSMKNGLVTERLVHLNGPERGMIRRQNESECQNPGAMLLRGLSLDVGEGDYRLLTDSYELLAKGRNRVAGRTVDVLHIVPKDKYRYGYSLAVDAETGLLMQSLLIDGGKKVLERFQFIHLKVGDVDEAELYGTQLDRTMESHDNAPCVEGAKYTDSEKLWDVSWLPSGFTLSGYETEYGKDLETFIYTDGLAVFSLFVEPESKQALPEVQAQRGATVAFLMHKQQADKNYRVCIVGEIPPATARKIAQSLSVNVD